MTKGTINTGFANVKTMDGSALPSPLAMQIGDYAYGTKSVTGSDLINFDHFYRKNGSRVDMQKLCKANAANMTFSEETEPGTPPDPDPDPVPVPNPSDVKRIISDVITYEGMDGKIYTQDMVPNGPPVPQ